MTDTPIAVVVPCRDAAAFLAEALASVAAQTRAPAEVVVVDDGSRDGSADIARAAGAIVHRLTTPVGNAEARNLGVRATRAPLIAFLDADDAWYPEHLATLGALLDQWPEAGAAFATCEVFGEGSGLHRGFLPEGPPRDAFDGCLRWWVGQPTGCMVRRSVFERVGGFDPSYVVGVDFDCWLRLARVSPFVASHAVTARYRRHDRQISGDGRRQAAMCWRARHAMCERLASDGDPRAQHAARLVGDFWEAECRRAWEVGDTRELRFLLGQVPTRPPMASAVRQWRSRAWLPGRIVRWWHGSSVSRTWHAARRRSSAGA